MRAGYARAVEAADGAAPREMMSGGWEWNVDPWPTGGDTRYEYMVSACTSGFANELADGVAYFVDKAIEPTRLSGTNSAISHVTSEPNQQSAVCPTLVQWLCSSRKDEWQCTEGEQCGGHHDCKAGVECDAELCYLLHPTRESRWVVLRNSKERWTEAMTLDECIHYSGEGQLHALAKECDFTRADVWRASFKAEAHGRREIVPPPSAPTSMPAGGALPEKADPEKADGAAMLKRQRARRGQRPRNSQSWKSRCWYSRSRGGV